MTVFSLVEEPPKVKYLNRHVRAQLCAACDSNPQAWKDLGNELIPDGDAAVRGIAANNQNVTTCCALMFDTWLQREPNASWRQLIDALNIIGLNKLAAEIAGKLESPTVSQVPKGMSLETLISLSVCVLR